jgi:hypothetical protein
MKAIIFSLLACFFVFAPAPARAQGGSLPQLEAGPFEIYNSEAVFYSGKWVYTFVLDTAVYDQSSPPITNITIATNKGDIECPNEIDGSSATRYTSCTLAAGDEGEGDEGEGETLTVSEAIATVGGKRYDITGSMAVKDFKPLAIVMPMTRSFSTSACPPVTAPIHPVTGTIASYDCEHLCELTVKLDDGTDVSYIVSDAVREALDNPASAFKPGAKARLTAEFQQFLEGEYAIPRCFKTGVFTSISPAGAY